MSDYQRTTRECPVSQFHPELREAFRRYFEEHALADGELETLLSCETISRKEEAGWLPAFLQGAQDETIMTGMVLTSQRLVWVRRGDRSGLVLNAADLKQIQVKAYKSLFTKDTGLEVFGFIGDSRGQVRGLIGMGTEPAAQKFCEEVSQAISKVAPPAPKTWASWLSR